MRKWITLQLLKLLMKLISSKELREEAISEGMTFLRRYTSRTDLKLDDLIVDQLEDHLKKELL